MFSVADLRSRYLTLDFMDSRELSGWLLSGRCIAGSYEREGACRETSPKNRESPDATIRLSGKFGGIPRAGSGPGIRTCRKLASVMI